MLTDHRITLIETRVADVGKRRRQRLRSNMDYVPLNRPNKQENGHTHEQDDN